MKEAPVPSGRSTDESRLPERRKRAERLERTVVAATLRGGLALSLGLFAIGVALKIHSGDLVAAGVPLAALFRSELGLADRLLGYGVLVLAATPALRAGVLLVLWAWIRDWRFAAVAVAVLGTLGVSLALGVAG